MLKIMTLIICQHNGRGPDQDVTYDLIVWYVLKTLYLSQE